jgi:hypothetical protein
MIICEAHGEQTEFVIGDKNYCPKCVQEVFAPRIKDYPLE